MLFAVENRFSNEEIDKNKSCLQKIMEGSQENYVIRAIYFIFWFFILLVGLSGFYLLFLYGVYHGNHSFESMFHRIWFVAVFCLFPWGFAIIASLPLIDNDKNKTFFSGLPWWQKIFGASIEYAFVFYIAMIIGTIVDVFTDNSVLLIFFGCVIPSYIIGCIRRKPPEDIDITPDGF